MKSFILSLGLLMSVYAWAEGTSSTSLENLQVGTGTAKFNGLLQAWFLNDTMEPEVTGVGQTNFRLRRAEMKLSGSVMEKSRWFLMVDPAKSIGSAPASTATNTVTVSTATDNKILQDLGGAYAYTDSLELTVGQFKIPTTAEGLRSPADMPFAERSIVGRTWGDKRQPGAMLTFKQPMFTILGMVSNGQRTNVDDTNASKDLTLRADVKPMEGLKVGAFNYMNDGRSKSAATAATQSSLGLDASYSKELWTFDLEGVMGQTDDSSGTVTTTSRGLMAEAIYKWHDQCQVGARYENLIVNPTLISTGYTLGISHLLKGTNAKAQLSTTIYQNMVGNNGTPSAASDRNGTVTILAFQTSI